MEEASDERGRRNSETLAQTLCLFLADRSLPGEDIGHSGPAAHHVRQLGCLEFVRLHQIAQYFLRLRRRYRVAFLSNCSIRAASRLKRAFSSADRLPSP